jgi:hypothetical protein
MWRFISSRHPDRDEPRPVCLIVGPHCRSVNVISRLFMLVGLVLCPCALFGKGPYVEYSTFQQWVHLVPEAQSLEVCGLTAAAHALWAQNQLRVPEIAFMQGDFSATGRIDWIVQLHQPNSIRSCDYLLIVSHSTGSWERLFLKEVRPTKGEGWTPLWYSTRRAIAIDIGEHRRRSAPARMFWSEGQKWSDPGFVVDDASIDTWIEWDKEQKKYESRKSDNAEWWEIEQEQGVAN